MSSNKIDPAKDEKELLRRLKADDRLALEIIYKRYWESLYKSAYRILQDHDKCADVIQDLFIKLWEIKNHLTIEVSLKGYLHSAVRYEVFRSIKTTKVNEDIFKFAETLSNRDNSDLLEYKELSDEINRIIETLPDRCREIFKLSRAEFLSHKEIAAQLSISTKTVEYHISKALQIIRNNLDDMLVLYLLFLY